jgi:Leucine-rich repeat (LRR) protein
MTIMASDVPDSLPPESHRFSIRLPRPLWIGLAAAVTMVAAVSLRIGVPAYQQWSAINEIQPYAYVNELFDETHRVGPQWLRDFVGESRMTAFDEIESLHFNPGINRDLRLNYVWMGPTAPVADDAVVVNIRKLPSLKRVDLQCTDVTDIAMADVGRLQRLEHLNLDGTDISDSGVSSLARLPRLKTLSLRGTRVTDACMASVSSMSTLQELDLSKTGITESGLNAIDRLKDLRKVTLYRTVVSKAFVENLLQKRPALEVRGALDFHEVGNMVRRGPPQSPSDRQDPGAPQ